MAGLNKVTIIGNLGRDPETRFTQGGMAVCTLSVGVTERKKDGDTWADHTEWFRVVVFGKTAENANKFLKKGRQVYVDGRLQTRSWQDKEGQTRYTTEIVANQLLFLGSGKDNTSSDFGGSDNHYSVPASSGDFNPPNNGAYIEEDIPF